MKIAIFGDSFADPYDSKEAISWTKLLKEKSNDYEITNFAKVATSLWWSYELFLKNYEKFDTIIFVITQYGRLECQTYNKKFLFSNLWNCEFNKPNNQYEEMLRETAINYFKHFQNSNQEQFLHEKIIEELYTIQKELSNKKFIIISAFPFNNNYKTFFDINLIDITDKELYTNFGNYTMKQETNYRANHMSKENNEILAEKVHQIVQGTCVQVTIDDFIFQKYPNPEKYWNI